MLREGYVIRNENELTRILRMLDSGDYTEFLDVFQPISLPPKYNPFDLFGIISERVQDMLYGGLAVASGFHMSINSICEMIQDMCVEDEDVAIGCAFLDRTMQYTVRHPIQSAIVCEVIAKGINYPRDARRSILAAAITMNMSSIALHEELQTFNNPLPKSHKLAIFDHPLTDFRTLQRLGVTDETWLTAVLQHHEAIDGSGYPQGIKGNNVTFAAQLVSLSDIYTAMVSSRSYRLPMPPDVAMRKVFEITADKVNEVFANLFIKKLGLYPPGTIVRLRNNEVGVVTYRGRSAEQPTVQAFFAPNGRPYTVTHLRDTSLTDYIVTQTLPQAKIDIPVSNEQLWQYGPFAKKGIANRRCDRIHVSCPAEITFEEDSAKVDPPMYGTVTNINEKGCLVKIPVTSLRQPIRGDSHYRLSFNILATPLNDVKFVIRNAYMSEKEHILGVKFLDLTIEQETLLGEYVKHSMP